MPIEPKIIVEFPRCFHCGSTLKVSTLGCADAIANGKIAKDVFTQLKAEVTPLEQPVLAGLMIEAIVTSWDACGNCGSERVTRMAVTKIPVQLQPPPSPGFRPPTFKH